MNNSEKMVVSLQNQDLERANKYFKRALRDDDDEILLDLAEYLESIGFFPQAKEIYQKLVAYYPELHLNLAVIAAEEDDMETAFAELDPIQSDSELYLQALLVTADLYQMEGLADVAREKLLEARRLSDDAAVIFGLAEIEFELGNFQAAINQYASLDNREIYEAVGVSTYQRIGVAYANLGKFEAAVEFLEKAVELEFDDQTVFELAALLFDQKNYQKANIYFKQLETLSPDFEGYEYAYAQSLHGEHLTEEALRMAQIGLTKNEFDTALLLLASQLSYELHDVTQAEVYLLKARDVAEDPNEWVLRLTNLYLEQARYEELLAFDSEEIENILAKWNFAKAYQALEDTDKAYTSYESLVQDLADNPEFLQDYIDFLREEGDLQQARLMAGKYLNLIADDLAMQEFYHAQDE